MAENKRSGKMYGKGPRIEPEPDKGDDNKSGHMADAAKSAESTATDTNAGVSNATDEGPKPDVMAGTAGTMGMADHQAQAAERKDAHHQRVLEHTEMHGRHENEHLMRATGNHSEDMAAMHARHHAERQAMHTKHEKFMKAIYVRHESPTMPGSETNEGHAGTNKE
jgi:hypothetical protein